MQFLKKTLTLATTAAIAVSVTGTANASKTTKIQGYVSHGVNIYNGERIALSLIHI